MGTALVTGATSGLGLEFAWQLATARHDLVVVARDAARLEALAVQLRAAAGVGVEVLPADLSVREDLERVAERLRATEHPVGLLVNNAGFGLGTGFVDSDVKDQERALDVMVRAVLVLSHAAAGQMRARGRGAILNVSSIASLLASGTYSAHKAWVRTFTEGLSTELQGTGVSATVVCPGLVRTEFHERAGIDLEAAPEGLWLRADRVAAEALAAVRRGSVINTPSKRYRVVAGTIRTLPRSAVRAFERTRPDREARIGKPYHPPATQGPGRAAPGG
jgi:short-subunit dehydrogenase